MPQVAKILAASIAAAWLVLGAHATLAQIDASKTAAAKKAGAAFASMSRGSATSGKPPRQSDPAVKALLDTVFDTRDVDAAKSIAFNEVQSALTERMMAGLQVSFVYMLAGTGKTDIAAVGADQAAMERVSRNVVEFAAEFGRFYDFQLKMQGAMIDGVLSHLSKSKPGAPQRDDVKSGLARFRNGTVSIVNGIVATMTEPRMPQSWRRERLSGLHAIAPRLARLLEPEEKVRVHKPALEAAAAIGDPQVSRSLRAFAAALER